jgi:chloride channel 3/4/5
VILVAKEGKLVGLVTVKDVLRHEAEMEYKHSMTTPTMAGSVGAGNGSPMNWRERMWTDDNAAGLEVFLEEAYTRLQALGDKVAVSFHRLRDQYGGSSQARYHRRTPSHEVAGLTAADYELQGNDR